MPFGRKKEGGSSSLTKERNNIIKIYKLILKIRNPEIKKIKLDIHR